MSQENVKIVRKLFDVWKEGPTDVPTDLVAPEIEFISPLTSLRGRPYCHVHGVKHDRGASQFAKRRHDSKLDAAAELLEEVEGLLSVSASVRKPLPVWPVWVCPECGTRHDLPEPIAPIACDDCEAVTTQPAFA